MQAFRRAIDLNTQEIPQIVKILKREPRGYGVNIYQLRVVASNDHIVDIDENIDDIRPSLVSEERCIRGGVEESLGKKIRAKFLIPRSWHLFQSIECFLQSTHIVWSIFVNKAWWLGYIDFLLQGALHEGVVDIDLTKSPSFGDCKM